MHLPDDACPFRGKGLVDDRRRNGTFFNIQHLALSNYIEPNFQPIWLFCNLVFVCLLCLLLPKQRLGCGFKVRCDFRAVTILEG